MNQIELHKKIDVLLGKDVKTVKVEEVSTVINLNNDAKQYFYSKVNEKWLVWLWKNDFMADIYKKASDLSSYSFRMPELNYLVRIAEICPEEVTKIILSVAISKDSYNPEVVDQFTSICSKLPAKYVKKLVAKIRDEQWVKLMGGYTIYGFEYGNILKKLSDVNDCESILVLAEAVLLVRTKKELAENINKHLSDDVFYIHDLVDTKIFTYLADINFRYSEQALSIVLSALNMAIKQGETYQLYDVDFFTLNLNNAENDSYKEDVKCLAAVILELTRKLFSAKSKDQNYIKNIYKKYIDLLPNSQPMRRLKLYVLSLKPDIFKAELMDRFYELFKSKNYYETIFGAEYEKALRSSFAVFTEEEKRDYVDNIFKLFTKKSKKDEKTRWNKHYASCILSVLSGYLTDAEKTKAEDSGFQINEDYEPKPTIGKLHSGSVNHMPLIDQNEFNQLTIESIVSKLKTEWSPEELRKNNDDFLNPRDADSVANQLKEDIGIRLSDYVENAGLFFDRATLVPHYTDAFLRGVKEALEKPLSENINLEFGEIINIFLNIKKSGETELFVKPETTNSGGWLADWDSVHLSICDLLESFIRQKDGKILINFKKYKNQILDILDYLLNCNDPTLEDEKLKSAKIKDKDPGRDYLVSDPFSIAINSIRGRSYQVLLHYIYQDNRNFNNAKISDDVKKIYEGLLKRENTRAIMFMFGHYLPTFYFRDRDWVLEKIDDIFESKDKDKYLKLASWEGYLSNNLYREIFFEPKMQKLYEEKIELKNIEYPSQKFFKNPTESIAIHFALAFTYYQEFDFEHPLFVKFWKNADKKQLSTFMNFIGSLFVSGNNIQADKFLKENEWLKQRLMDLWDKLLERKSDIEILKEMGSWMNNDKQIFDSGKFAERVEKTFVASNGQIRWSYALMKSIENLAKETPLNAVAILKSYFLNTIKEGIRMGPIYVDKEWYNAFKILYSNPDEDIKKKTYDTISLLIQKGGRPFWSLEEIVR